MKVKFKYLESILMGILELNDCKMSFQLKLELRDIQEKLRKEATWFMGQRMELISKYSKKDEKGQPLTDGDSYILNNPAGFQNEYNDLLETEFEIEPIPAELVSKFELSGKAWDGLFHILERGENVNEG